ncbi:hypothetical protein F4777DRAFT_557370 [Nemania sp. FL0916]|nr:hypothetical protein F4777DRAFT_557370 [Nemania sp. FL0916]
MPYHTPASELEIRFRSWQWLLDTLLLTRVYTVVGQTSQRLLDPLALLPPMLNVDCLIHGVLQYACCSGWMYDSISQTGFTSLIRVTYLCGFLRSVKANLTSSWTMVKREQIRARFDIAGEPLNDCCISF